MHVYIFTWQTEGIIWAMLISLSSFLRVKLHIPMSLTRFSLTSFSISLHTPSMLKSNTSPALGGLLAPSFSRNGQWICIFIKSHASWVEKVKNERWILSIIKACYQVKIKVVKLEFLKGILKGRSNPFRFQVSAPIWFKISHTHTHTQYEFLSNVERTYFNSI